MADRDRFLNYRSLTATLVKNRTGQIIDIPPIDLAVEPAFQRRFNMSRNPFGKNQPTSFTDTGQEAIGNLTVGNGRGTADYLELLYLLEFEQVSAEIPYAEEIVVGASGQTFNAVDDAWEISAAAAGEEGNGMAADIMEAYRLDATGTLQSALVPRETFAASGAVTSGSYQQGADRQLRISNALVGCTLKLRASYTTTTLRLSERDPGTYTIIAKAVRSEDNQVGIFEADSWVPDGTAPHNPAAENAEIPGHFLFTGQQCDSPYQFFISGLDAVCLNQ